MRDRRLICIIVEQPTPFDVTGRDVVDCASEQHAELSCRNGAVTNRSPPRNQQDCQISRADPKVTQERVNHLRAVRFFMDRLSVVVLSP